MFGLVGKIKDVNSPKRVLLQGWRMTRADIQNIMTAAMAFKNSLPQGIDFIPSGATSKKVLCQLWR